MVSFFSQRPLWEYQGGLEGGGGRLRVEGCG